MTAKKNAMIPVAPISKLNASHRASQGWQMRVQGFTWEQIAKATGYHDGPTAYRAVKNYFGSVPAVDHDMQRQIARERTEFLQRKALEQVDTNPTPANIHAAVETLRRAAALDGLDAAMKVAVETTEGDVMQFVETVLSMAGKDVPREADIFADEYVFRAVGETDGDQDESGEGAMPDEEPIGEEWYARRRPSDV